MKNIIILSLFLSTFYFANAQEVGKAGKLIRNEATTTEVNSINRAILNDTDLNVSRSTSSTNNRNNSLNRSDSRKPSYQWNFNYGSAEVFLRIPEQGYYSVQLNDQVISSATGKYRFFDVASGRNILSIYRNNYLVYKAPLQIQNNMRTILDFFEGFGLYLLDSYSIRNENYGINQWDDVWNNPYNGGGYDKNRNNRFSQTLNDREFDSFLKSLDKNALFDDDKIIYLRQQIRSTFFTSEQIKTILSKISFDKNKITAAKDMYLSCADPKNYYIVYESLAFKSSRNEVMEYIASLNR